MSKVCPECAEKVQSQARVCRYCGFRFAPEAEADRSPTEASQPTTDVAGLGELPKRQAHPSDPDKPAQAKPEKRRWPWVAAAFLILGLVVAGVALAVHLNGQKHLKSGNYSDTALNPKLPVGGLSSDSVPLSVADESLANFEAVGYRILTDAVQQGAIDSFRAIPPTGRWSEQFRLDGEEFTLSFTKGHHEYLIEYPTSRTSDAKLLTTIAGEHGFDTISEEGRKKFDKISDRTEALTSLLKKTELTEGVEEPTIFEEAADIRSEWIEWLASYEAEQDDLDALAQAELSVAAAAEELASDPTEERLDAYNATLGDLDAAVDSYNRNLEHEQSE